MNRLLLALAAATLAVHAAAQTEPLAVRARAFESDAAAAVAAAAPADVFAGVGACATLDIRTIRAWTLEEAADLAKPCLNAVGAKLQSALVLQAGFLTAAAEDRPALPGLLLKADVVPGSPAHRDLVASLSRRNNEILGHRVRVLARGEVAPASVSAVQGALGQCIMTTVVRDIQTSADFVRLYGRCLTRNPDLKIDEVRAGEGMTVMLKTEQAPVAVEALNGFVTVNAGKGPVQLMVLAYAAPVARP